MFRLTFMLRTHDTYADVVGWWKGSGVLGGRSLKVPLDHLD